VNVSQLKLGSEKLNNNNNNNNNNDDDDDNNILFSQYSRDPPEWI
jgi:hypothetical protein